MEVEEIKMDDAKSSIEEFFDAYFSFLRRTFCSLVSWLKTCSPYVLIPCGCLLAMLCLSVVCVLVILIIWIIFMFKII